jgi:stage II sporulation protein D
LGIVPSLEQFSPDVRVNVSPGGPLRVAIDGPYEVRLEGTSHVLSRGDKLVEQSVSAASRGLRIGPTEFPAGRLELTTERDPAIWVNDHQYRGRLRLYRRTGGEVLAVNVLPLEEYLASVVDSEMPAAFPEQARRAQAVVARTYVLSHMQERRPLFDVYASTQSQKYLGYQYWAGGRRLAGESAASRRVVADTAGQVCTWRGKLFCTYYSAVCGGRTADGGTLFADAVETHRSVPCDWCRESDHYHWTVGLPKARVEQAVRKICASAGQRFGRLSTIRPSVGGVSSSDLPAGWEVGDGEVRRRITRRELFDALPGLLSSDRFTIELAGDRVVFHGRGHGHGVGLCQWGARGLALAGRSSTEILRHYYPGARVVVLEPARRR